MEKIDSAERLRKWREAEGLSQIRAAEVFGRKRRAYQKWELNEAPVPKFVSVVAAAYSTVANKRSKKKHIFRL